ncbi:MAG: hypothetical protein A3J97_16950 [Spirochaetes bacterium RIFOXYC1_FULL_54_7]|nr:MAG: hypothetical protein A3J97_16950 [Spirochaetes bacterium RIFOXYC1_FULL_54_7]
MEQKQLPDDFRDFIASLNKHEVLYLLVGGWALGIHGHPRATKDIDFLVATDDANLERLQGALADFGAPPLDAMQFKGKNAVYRMGRPPIQIDLINRADGIDILECYSRRKLIYVDSVEISLISRQDLIANKRASGRLQDLADIEKIASSG